MKASADFQMERDLIELIFKTTFIPSLEKLALITYAINIWKGFQQVFVMKDIDKSWREYSKLEALERTKIDSLPDLITEKITSVVLSVGDNFFNGIEFSLFGKPNLTQIEFSRYYTFDESLIVSNMKSVKWTRYGTISEAKTWEALTYQLTPKDENVRFYFDKSCKFCNETLIQKFWSQMPEDDQRWYNGDYDAHAVFDYLTAYWATKLADCSDSYFNVILHKRWGYFCKYLEPFLYGSQFKTLDELMFVLSIVNKKYHAAEYFLNKLTLADVSVNIVEITKTLAWEMFHKECADHKKKYGTIKIIWLLLSHMKNEEVLDVLKEGSSYILRVFNLHPLVAISFFDIWSIARQFITLEDYSQIVTKVLSEIKKGRVTMSVFRGLWKRTSLEMKKSFLGIIFIREENQQQNNRCQVRFCEAVTLKTLEIIFDDDELKNVKPGVNFTCQLLIESEKYDTLDYLLNVTSSNFSKFKQKFFETRGMAVYSYFLLTNDVDKINVFLEWIMKSLCEDEKIKFKRIVIKNTASDFCRVCLKNDKLQELEKFLNHFGSGSEDLVLAEKEIKAWKKVLKLVFPGKISDFDGVSELKREIMKKLDNCTVHENWLEVKEFLDWRMKKTAPKVEIISFKNSIINMLGSKFFRYVIDHEDFKGLDEIMSWFFCDRSDFKWKCHDYKMRMVKNCGFYTLPKIAGKYYDNDDDYFADKYDFLIWFFKDDVIIPRWNSLKDSIIEDDDYCVDIFCHMIARDERNLFKLFLNWGFSHLFLKSNFQNKLNTFKKRVMERMAEKYDDAEQSALREFLGWGVFKQVEIENLIRMIYSKPFIKKCKDNLWEVLSNLDFALDKPLVPNEEKGNVSSFGRVPGGESEDYEDNSKNETEELEEESEYYEDDSDEDEEGKKSGGNDDEWSNENELDNIWSGNDTKALEKF